DGISSWFLPTDLEEHEGGKIVVYMGETNSPGTVTGWDPPRRLAYEEPEWARLAEHEDAPVTPLATEFLVEAQSGGTCVVRVVTSAFGTGADWEQEFFEEMEKSWAPFFDRLRLYLRHFAGQRATVLEANHTVSAPAGPVFAAMRQALGATEAGQTVTERGLSGQVERIGKEDLLLQVTDPVPGYVGFVAFGMPDGTTSAMIHGHLFSDAAPAFVEREQPAWQAWLQGLAIPAAQR
ncbi:MAG: SRPBCC family protein, partial [Acidimicrobiales bacterium]